MFTATFTKSIYNGPNPSAASAVALFTRKDSLPFAPMAQMYLSWPNDVEHFVGKVVWNFDDEAFVCEVHDCNEAGANSDFKSLVKNSVNAGWTLISENQIERKKSFWEKNP